MTDVYGQYLRTLSAVRRARLFAVQVTARRKGKKNASFASDPYSAQRRCETISRKARGRGDTYALPGKTYEAYQWKRVFYYQHSSRLDAGMCWAVGTRMEGHVIKRLLIVSAHVAVSTQTLSKRQLMKAVFL